MLNNEILDIANALKKNVDLEKHSLDNFYLLYTIYFCAQYIDFEHLNDENIDFRALKEEALSKINNELFSLFDENDPKLAYYSNIINRNKPRYTIHDPLGSIYIICSEKNKIKKLGEHYTNNNLVEFILRELDTDFVGKSIVDPACGSGNFLIRILEQSLNDKDEYVQQEIIQKMQNNEFIIGYDIQHTPCLITKLRMVMEIVHHTRKLDTRMKFPVFKLNSLLDHHSVLIENGFDIVVTNPPYLRYHSLTITEREALKNIYESAIGRFDLFTLFIEKSLKLINNEGRVAILCSDKFLSTEYGKGVRSFIKKNSVLKSIYNLENIFSFKATVLSGVYIFEKNQHNNRTDYYDVISKSQNFKKIRLGEVSSDEDWKYIDYKTKKILSNIEKSSTANLEDICESISLGIQTTADDIFCEGLTNDTVEALRLEKELIFPMLRGKNLKKWFYKWTGNTPNKDTNILYPYLNLNDNSQRVCLSHYPFIENYLNNHFSRLGNRTYIQDSSSKVWYDIWNERSFKIFKGTKILTPEIASSNSFSLDTEGYFYNGTIYGIKLLKQFGQNDYKYILALLNSNVLTFVHQKRSSVQLKSKKYRYKAQLLRKYPLILLNEQNGYYRDIINLVDSLILYNQESHEINIALNKIVYNIYNIKLDEQIFIEKSIRN